MWVGVYELWESLRPSVGARSSVSHQAATVETLDMPMFILVPAGVLRASSHRLFFVKGLITRPALSRFRPVLLSGTGLYLLSVGV